MVAVGLCLMLSLETPSFSTTLDMVVEQRMWMEMKRTALMKLFGTPHFNIPDFLFKYFFSPLDYEKAGQITDDDLYNMMCASLPQGVRFTAIFDSCHSGSVLDLPLNYVLDGNGELQPYDPKKIIMDTRKFI
jgi:hypothetical protein